MNTRDTVDPSSLVKIHPRFTQASRALLTPADGGDDKRGPLHSLLVRAEPTFSTPTVKARLGISSALHPGAVASWVTQQRLSVLQVIRYRQTYY